MGNTSSEDDSVFRLPRRGLCCSDGVRAGVDGGGAERLGQARASVESRTSNTLCLPSTGWPTKHFHILFFFNKFIYYLFLAALGLAVRGLSLVAASGSYSLLRCPGFSLWWLLVLRSTGSRCAGFSRCGMWAQ